MHWIAGGVLADYYCGKTPSLMKKSGKLDEKGLQKAAYKAAYAFAGGYAVLMLQSRM